MYKLLIADDEKNIRDGLQAILDWKQLGFEVVGEAANGEEALQKIRSLQPDVVLMDLHMPRVHGIDVIRISREEEFSGRFIILSGYSDFGYAQSAIRYGVTNYLTKPIDEDELEETVRHITEEIEAESKNRGNLHRMSTKARDVVLQELLLGEEPNGEKVLPAQEDLISLKLQADMYQVVIYELYHTDRHRPSYNPGELMSTIMEKGSYESCELENRQVLLLKNEGAIRRFSHFLEHYGRRPPQENSPLDTMFLVYGNPVEKPQEVAPSYHQVKKVCDRRFFFPQGTHTVDASGVYGMQERKESISSENLHGLSTRLIGYLQAGSVDKVGETLKEIEHYLHSVQDEIPDVRLFVKDLFLQVKEQIGKSYPECIILFDSNSDIINFIDTRFYLYEIMDYLGEKTKEMLQRIRERNGAESTMQDVLSYVEHNFQSPLTLEEVAPLFGYNSVYFGKLFTKTTGTSFKTYINNRRIREAKELLENGDRKIYEIAQLVGYSDVDYFSKKFRAAEGMSPADYRRQVQNGVICKK